MPEDMVCRSVDVSIVLLRHGFNGFLASKTQLCFIVGIIVIRQSDVAETRSIQLKLHPLEMQPLVECFSHDVTFAHAPSDATGGVNLQPRAYTLVVCHSHTHILHMRLVDLAYVPLGRIYTKCNLGG